MTSLNSKRSGGFSRSKGSNSMGNSKNQEGFGGKRMERHGGNKIALSTKNNTGICSGCQKKGEALFKPSTEKERYCINCFTKKIKDKK